jgi:hypothetical protein
VASVLALELVCGMVGVHRAKPKMSLVLSAVVDLHVAPDWSHFSDSLTPSPKIFHLSVRPIEDIRVLDEMTCSSKIAIALGRLDREGKEFASVKSLRLNMGS